MGSVEQRWVLKRFAGEAIRAGDALTSRVGEDGIFRVYRRGQGDPGYGTAVRDFWRDEEIPADGVATGYAFGGGAGRIPDSTTPQGEKRQFSIDLGGYDSATRGTMRYAIVDLVRRFRDEGLDIDAAYDAAAMQMTVTVRDQAGPRRFLRDGTPTLPREERDANLEDLSPSPRLPESDDISHPLILEDELKQEWVIVVGLGLSTHITIGKDRVVRCDGHPVWAEGNDLMGKIGGLDTKLGERRRPVIDERGPVTREMWDTLLARIGSLEDRTSGSVVYGAFDMIPAPSVPVGQVVMRETTKPTLRQMIDELREILAEHEHATWASYIKYFIEEKCHHQRFTQFHDETQDREIRFVDDTYAQALLKLADTTYPMLDEDQKNKDRREVAPLIPRVLAWARRYGLTNP